MLLNQSIIIPNIKRNMLSYIQLNIDQTKVRTCIHQKVILTLIPIIRVIQSYNRTIQFFVVKLVFHETVNNKLDVALDDE